MMQSSKYYKGNQTPNPNKSKTNAHTPTGKLRICMLLLAVMAVTALGNPDSVRKAEAKSKYSNPFSSFKIGKKDFAPRFKKKSTCALGDPLNWDFSLKGKQKINIKMKKGYKLKKIVYTELGIYKKIRIKNGAKLNFSKKNVWELIVTYKDKNNKSRKATMLFPPYY